MSATAKKASKSSVQEDEEDGDEGEQDEADVDEEEDDEISDEEETTPASVPRATSLEVIYIYKKLNSSIGNSRVE